MIYISQARQANSAILAQLIWTTCGVIFVGYLLVAEIILKAICPACTVVHITSLAAFYFSVRIYQENQRSFVFINFQFNNFIWDLKVFAVVIGVLGVTPLLYFNTADVTSQPPAQIDKLRECLEANISKVQFFGLANCHYCQNQKKLLGELMALVDYVDCVENTDTCDKLDITGFPTWVRRVNGMTEQRKGLMKLGALEEFVCAE